MTGGAGFIGSHLCKRLLDEGNEVISLDNYFTGSKDNIIHLGRCEYSQSVSFELGRNVQSMSRSESKDNFATRLYVFGSERNLPTNYRENTDVTVEGIVQKRLMLPIDPPYIDAYPDMPQEQAVEGVVIFDDVYPRRIGTMSGITTKEYIDTIENEDGTTE